MTTFQTFRRHQAPAGLDFAVEAPENWVAVPLPDETPDFTDPLHFTPVGVLMAPYAAIVFSVAARPAYGDGTVAQWLDYSARQRGLDPGAIEAQAAGPHQGVGCWGIQVDNGTTMRVRIACFEDGERLVNVSCMAPDELWPTVQATFAHMLSTFCLATPRGSTAALTSPDSTLPASTLVVGAPIGGKAVATAPPEVAATTPGPLGLPIADDALPIVLAATIALATDMQSFTAEHPLNERLRDNGVGLVPNTLDYDAQEQWATLAPAAISGTMRVPFGWHVLDDGKRTLVFDAAGHTQVSLQLVMREGRSDDEFLAEKIPELQREWPNLRHLRTRVGGMECLCVRDATVNGKPIEQAYLVRRSADELLLQTRITSSPEQFQRACDLAEILLRDMQLTSDAVDG